MRFVRTIGLLLGVRVFYSSIVSANKDKIGTNLINDSES